MKTNYKIFVLPLVVCLFALGSIIIEKPFEPNKTTFSKTFPFPFKQVPKTEWAKPDWSNKVSKSFSTFICSLTKNKIERPNVFTIFNNEQKIFYSSSYLHNYSGRAPPNFS